MKLGGAEANEGEVGYSHCWSDNEWTSRKNERKTFSIHTRDEVASTCAHLSDRVAILS